MGGFSRGLWICVLLALTACGFRLAGTASWPVEWPGFRLDNQLAGIDGEDFTDLLRGRLLRAGLDPQAEPFARIRLRSLEQRKLTSALDANGRAAEFEIQNRLVFQVDAGGRISPELAVVAQRRLSFDPGLALAKQQEEVAIKAALDNELVELLLLRVEAELRALKVGAGAHPPGAGAWSAE